MSIVLYDDVYAKKLNCNCCRIVMQCSPHYVWNTFNKLSMCVDHCIKRWPPYDH